MGRLYIGPEMIEVTKLVKDKQTLMGYRGTTLVIEINNINWKDTDIYWEDIEVEIYVAPEIATKNLELENQQLKVRLESIELALMKLMDNTVEGK
jgi:hypothetical protein